ncbi:hypothetical protein ACQ4LE_000602 [Meloidogyne hapla]|uniref:PAZ domain-containing protein n=1 Tax=Meloidogyne hapla TaxID=6305 RepID=A0A1I8BTT5_MELHA
MVLLIDECAKILKCNVKSLRDELNHPSNRELILNKFKGKKLRTTYRDHNGFSKTIVFDDLSHKGANNLQAYGRLSKHFNVTVAAHFYARHRIRLFNPFLHCVIETFPRGENRFYPLELLELIDEKENPKILMNIFKDGTSENSNKNLIPDKKKSIPLSDIEEEEEDETYLEFVNGW